MEWIEHDGVSHLPDKGRKVDVQFRSGRFDKGFSVGWYEGWAGTRDHWMHDGGGKDIVRYLLGLSTPKPTNIE